MKKAFSILDTKEAGEALNSREVKQLQKVIDYLLEAVAERRDTVLSHDSLKNTIGLFFQILGFNVEYEVPFQTGGFTNERVVFDVVAESGKDEIVIEVKDEITSRDLGQVYGYANTLQLAKEKAKVYLGTDVLNYNNILFGMTGEMTKELMRRESIGVILADNYFLIICDNYNQLTLCEMPQFLFSEEKVE